MLPQAKAAFRSRKAPTIEPLRGQEIQRQLIELLRRFHIHHMPNARHHYAARPRDTALDHVGGGVEIRQIALADNHQGSRANVI